MRISALNVSNFMSITNVSTNLSDKGLVLIQGNNEDDDSFESNGSGKSTIFTEAIVWGLFGKTIRGLTGDAVVNRKVKKNTMVSITIEEGDSQYIIQRMRKDSIMKNKVLLAHNSKDITAKSDADTNALIEDILQMDYLSFTNSIIFGQGLSKMFASSTDTEQKKILEKMLQIGIFQECQEVAKGKKSLAMEEKLRLETTAHQLKSKWISLEGQLTELQDKEAELGENIAIKIEGYEQEIVELKEHIEGCIEAKSSLKEDTEIFTDATKQQEELINKYSKEEKEYDRLGYKGTEIDRQLTAIESQIIRTNRSLEDVVKGINVPDTCSKCGQKLEAKDNSHVMRHLKEKLLELESQAQGLEAERTDINSKRLALKAVIRKLDTAKAKKDKYYGELKNVERDIAKRDMDIANDKKSIARLEIQIKEQQELAQKTYTDLINSAIASLKANDAEMEQVQKDITEQERQIELYNFWVTAYGNQGIKSVLLDSVVPFLDSRANYYVGKLSGSSIEIKFHTQELVKSTGVMKDKFSVEVINHNGDDNYKGNSGGEKRRVDIAINMALQDLVQSRSNKRLDLIVYDEMWEGLDDVGCESAIELLREKAEEFGSVFVITHSAYLQKLFSNVITVNKKDGKTTLKED